MRHAFTLIELLVVISIIALLIAILLPTLMRSKESARRAQCASNMHQFQLGVINYTLEHDGYFPNAKRDNGGYETRFISTPTYHYILEASGGDADIFKCPGMGEENQGNGAMYLPVTDTPPNGLGWRLGGYIHLGGFDVPWPTWDSPITMDTAKPDWKILTDFNYQPGPNVPNPSVGMHGPKGAIRLGGVKLTPSELGIEGGNAAIVDGSVRWINVRDMKQHPTGQGGGAWNWH